MLWIASVAIAFLAGMAIGALLLAVVASGSEALARRMGRCGILETPTKSRDVLRLVDRDARLGPEQVKAA